MSFGLTPQEFVKQVYYVQEKVLLDFYPSDDKYKEVLYEANLVLQELQKEEDWLWLRKRIMLGDTCADGSHKPPEYRLPEWVYKVSSLQNDGVRLHAMRHCRNFGTDRCDGCLECIDEKRFIRAPFTSAGFLHHVENASWDEWGRVDMPNDLLGAVVIGDTLTFTRPLHRMERNRIAVTDIQRRIGQMHVCDKHCKADKWIDENGLETEEIRYPDHPCNKIEDKVLCDVPDPNYVIIRTAALHAQGSPPAQGRISGLQDQALKLLSAMRENNAAATYSDYMSKDRFGFINVV